MIAQLRQPFSPLRSAIPTIVTAGVFAILSMLIIMLVVGGSVFTSLGLAAVIAFAFPVVWLAWYRPIVFPLSAYALMIPFDNISEVGSLTSLTRLLGALSALAISAAIVRRRELIPPERAVYAWGAAVLWIVLSALWAMNQSTAIEFVGAYLQLFGLFAVVAIYPFTRKDYGILMSGVVAGGFIAAAAGAVLFSHGQDVQNGRLLMQAGGRVIDENHNAAALLLPFAFALIAALRERHFLKQVGLAVVAATIAYGIIITASRGGFLAMVAIVVMLLIRSRYKLELAVGFVAVGIAASASALSKRVDTVVSSGGAGRFEIWSSAWAAFKTHWLAGFGTGNFQDAYDSVYLEVYHPSYLHWHIVAHNLIAQTGVELGIVGLGLVAFAWYAVLRDPAGAWQFEPFADWWRAAQAGGVGLLVASMFLDLAWYKDPWLAFMLAVAAKNVLSEHVRTTALAAAEAFRLAVFESSPEYSYEEAAARLPVRTAPGARALAGD